MAPLSIATLVAGLAILSSAKELVVDMNLKAELYDSGLVHERIMATKEVSNGRGRVQTVPSPAMANQGVASMGRNGKARCI
jgi:hypothetical protein